MTSNWIEYQDAVTDDDVMGFARGCYQRAILRGAEAMSGSTLEGRAGTYRGRYISSRVSLTRRIQSAGFRVGETVGEHNRRILVIGR